MGKSGPEGKPFQIPKRLVWEAYKSVKRNKGAAGVDGQSIEDFEADLRNNLYKIWNRMSSGTYFPPPVRAVEIPKPHGGGTRMLGVPTVADRIAQTVAALQLEPRMESIFHDDSYGYRPGRSPLDAVAKCRERCWKKDWLLDLDVQKFFDSVDHDLMVKAVEVNTGQKWVVLYVRRWLKAPIQMPDGRLVQRERGTPQGSAVSPVLANLFMHYAFDSWLEREFPAVEFERFADDAVVHCATERQALQVRAALSERMEEVGLRLHPDKTKVVYCKDRKRRLDYECTSFTFLGYTFRARKAPTRDGKSPCSSPPRPCAPPWRISPHTQRLKASRSRARPNQRVNNRQALSGIAARPGASKRRSEAGQDTATSVNGTPAAAHPTSRVDTAVEEVNRVRPHKLVDPVPLPRLHRERRARAVRDLQLVHGEVPRAQLRDRGSVVLHPVHQDRALAPQVTR